MRRHVLSNLDELDLEARELAKAAARQAGLSLEEWAAAILAAKDQKRTSQPPESEPKPASHNPSGPIARYSLPPRSSATARPELQRTFETLMAAVAAESERQAEDHASRTAIALESMASWIEQTEERLNETTRSSADHQDRMATALSQALSTLKSRIDTVERQAIAERSSQSDNTWMPAVDAIRAEIESLRASMGNLATHEEITSLDHALKGIAKDIGQSPASKDLLILAQSTAAVYRQIQALSEDVNDGLHRRIGGEIDQLKARIDKMAATGIDRTVVDFLSSQIVDMRHDLSQRAEPCQIERLSEEVTSLGRQIADLRIHQGGRNDFSALKASLENVCAALNRTVVAQEASDMPVQIESMSRDLAALASRPEPQPVNLDPITDQLALLTERMADLSESRFRQGDALNDMIARLSAQVESIAEKEAPSQEPLMKRFDTIEEELRQVSRQQVSQQADTSSMEHMLRNIDEKLDRAPLKPMSLDKLEQQITSLAKRLAEKSDEPLQKVLEETTSHLRKLQNDAAGIAERAAKAALKDFQPNLPDASDLEALKQGFVELKALQTRADKKTQETLRAVHSALDTLVSRFPEQGAVAPQTGPVSHAVLNTAPEHMPPADRLEAAVRRLHAVTLSQIEEVATARSTLNPEPKASELTVSGPVVDEADLGNVRASFIAAARRAAQADKVDQTMSTPSEEMGIVANVETADATEAPSESPSSLMERIRRSIDTHRRSLLLGLGFVILATGTAQVISNGLVPSPLALIASRDTSPTIPHIKADTDKEAAQTGSLVQPEDKTDLFQPSSLAAAPVASSAVAIAAPKFLVDPATVGDIPVLAPAGLRQAALAGDAAALYDIASRAAEGHGLPQDMSLAIHLYERAAQAGLPPAQERLAMLLDKGIGIARDPKQAVLWYERAAQGGNIRAMHNLATLLASGANGKPDYAAALRWYGEAAEAGLKDSQFNMGVLLTRGIGTKQDVVKAYKWFSLAAAQGDADAAKKRDELATRLSPSELKAAQTAIGQWQPRPIDPIANEVTATAGDRTAALDRTAGERS